MKYFLPCLLLSSFAISCSTIDNTSKHKMQRGIYRVKHQPQKHYYAVANDDSIALHPATKTKRGWQADTANATIIDLNSTKPGLEKPLTFIRRKLDFDVLTILFKYRPATEGVPNQLNTNFNAAGYLGYATDVYRLSNNKNPLNRYERKMHRIGYTFGLFAGIGSPEIKSFVLRDQVDIEYDGFVITGGATGMINIGKLRFGIALGFDHLMDTYRKYWIYEKKPWVGFSVGYGLK